MEKQLSCGSYRCCITGKSDLIMLLPNCWKEYEKVQQSFSETVSIYLEMINDKNESIFPDGWTVYEEDGELQAVYAHGGKAIFDLKCRKQHEVTARIKRITNSSLRVCIHYALMLALCRECIGLHGVTLLCGKEIVILSAPSGTGKTTLAKLLEKYCDSIVINGDFALLHPMEDGVIFEPTPFCGTSGRALNHRFRVNRIVFLGQDKENHWRELDGREAMTRFMSNAFVPKWDSGMTQAVQENILKCMDMLKVNAYDFAPTKEAAEMFLKKINESSSPFSE